MFYNHTLYLLRHAKAVDATPGLADFDRALTEEGRAQCEQIKEQLAGITFNTIICSAAKRTVETAELVLGEQKFQKLRQLYNASAPAILGVLAEYAPSRAEKVLIIAHNPGLSDLTRQLAATNPSVTGLHEGSMSIYEITGEWNKIKPATTRFISLFNAA